MSAVKSKAHFSQGKWLVLGEDACAESQNLDLVPECDSIDPNDLCRACNLVFLPVHVRKPHLMLIRTLLIKESSNWNILNVVVHLASVPL